MILRLCAESVINVMKVTLHPDFEALKNYCSILEERLLRLIVDKEELVSTVIPNLEAEYQIRIGSLMFHKFCLQTEINKAKRTIEIIQSSLNRGESADRQSIEKTLEVEFSDWEERLKEHLAMIEKAREIEKSRLSVEESEKITRLYRQLVRKLHPDINEETYLQNKSLWDQVQSLYQRSDLKGLESVWKIAQGLEELDSEAPSTMELMREREGRLKESIKEVRESIAEICSVHPYTLRDRLLDSKWVLVQRRILNKEIADLSVQKSRFKIMAEQMTREHCHE